MAYDCRVLVCDEPTYAQDRISTMAIMDALCRQAREHDVAVIFSTHDLQLARDYADEIYRLEGGHLNAKMESGM
jgi:energy-coupling factor transport system ATP-binding protein